MQPNFELREGSYSITQFPSGELQTILKNDVIIVGISLEEIRSKLKGNL